MNERMILAGSGGQGLLTLGKLLVTCGMAEGRHVTYFPAYGTEVRGGTAHCHVIMSDEEIFSPLVEEATALLVMNQPSLDRFGPLLARGGLLVVNTSMASAPKPARGRTIVGIPASRIATELGDVRVANMVLLGALNRKLNLIGHDRILTTLAASLKGPRRALMPLNETALARGEELANMEVESKK